MINKQAVQKLISVLLADIPKLKTDKSYYYNEPMYFNYAIYYDSLCEALLALDEDKPGNIFGTYLTGFVAYQILDNGKELWEVAQMLIEQLQEKLKELEEETIEEKEEDQEVKYQA